MKPHVVCVPIPVQSHIGGMLTLAKILHHKGIFITFVNTDFNHHRLLRSGGLTSLDSLPDWRFVSIPDGIPPSNADGTQEIPALCDSRRNYIARPLLDLTGKLNEEVLMKNGLDVPPISHIVADGFMNFAVAPAAETFQLPLMHLFTLPACAICALKHYRLFMKKCLMLSKGELDQIKIGWSDSVIDWIPGLKNMRPCDMPNFFGATDDSDTFLSFIVDGLERSGNADVTIVNTFEEMELIALEALSSMIPNIYAIGPFHLFLEKMPQVDPISLCTSTIVPNYVQAGCV